MGGCTPSEELQRSGILDWRYVSDCSCHWITDAMRAPFQVGSKCVVGPNRSVHRSWKIVRVLEEKFHTASKCCDEAFDSSQHLTPTFLCIELGSKDA